VEHNPSQQTDEAAAQRVQKGDAEAFGILVERYEAKLLRYGRKFLSRTDDIVDITQDVFMKTYENIQSFDPSLKFSPWIYRIAHNHFVNALRAQKRNPLVLVDFDTILAHPVYEDPAPREREEKEIGQMLDRGLQSLHPKYREVLVLYYIEELSYKEIADVLQVPLGTVGIRIKRAKEALKAACSDLKEIYGA
jgi:RNA polymerase sigma-70 factor (ECF subfamily)